MHVHNVYFWLKKDLSDEDIAVFVQGLDALIGDPDVKTGYYGIPADTHRDVVENSYSFGLVLVFDDIAGHDRYQVGNIHDEFLAANKLKWEKFVVYDIETP